MITEPNNKYYIVKENTTARSKHTDPKDIRAKRRVQSPREPRGTADPSHRKRIGRMLKEMGIAYTFQEDEQYKNPIEPRIIVKRPQKGYIHAFDKSDLLRLLDFVGAEAIYGLKSIELTHQPAESTAGPPAFGQLIVPGRIKIYEQQIPPWRLPGLLAEAELSSMQRSGAQVKIEPKLAATFVDWPGDSLGNFMLFEVLLHEIGHHILQHNKGKRTIRIARTSDHEAFARTFAARYRTAWFEEEISE